MKNRVDTDTEFFAKFYKRAKDLHTALVNSKVPAREVPRTIIELRDLYRTAIFNDQRTFQSKRFSGSHDGQVDPSIIMARILNAFVQRNLNENDYAALESLNLAEAERLRNYLRFENETIQYALFVRHYMIRLKREIIGDTGAKSEVASFYGDGSYPGGVQKALKVLKDIEDIRVPIALIRRFEQVFIVFESVKPSEHRPQKAQEYYDSKLAELHTFNFINEVLNNIKWVCMSP